MRKKAATSVFSWLGRIASGPLLVVACSGSAFSPSGSTSGGSAGVAGSGAAGGVASGGSSSGGEGGGSQETCDKSQCGPQLGLPNEICSDGSTAGPTGRCLKNASGSCGWEIRQCPAEGAGGDAAGTGGAGSGGGGSGAMPDCAGLLDDVKKAQAAAQTCNPASARPAAECAGSLEGVCCPIGVEAASPAAPDNAAYLSALKAYKASCSHQCPRIACFEPMVGNCKASGNGYACMP